MNLTADLKAELVHAHDFGGYEKFVIEDEQGRRFDLINVEWPGNNLPVVLRLRPAQD